MGKRHRIDGLDRLERCQPRLLLGAEDLTGPTGGSAGIAAKTGNVDLAEHSQVVIASEHDVGAGADQVDALVWTGSIADGVAQTPECIEAITLCFEDGFERLEVAMNIGENNDAHLVTR